MQGSFRSATWGQGRGRIGILAVAVALGAGACQSRLPTAPSTLVTGVVIYEHAGFGGDSAYVRVDIPDLEDFRGPCEKTTYDSDGTSSTTHSWDDCVSSIRVAPGWRATLYEHPNYKGWAADVGEENVVDYQQVPGPCKHDSFNDCASSVRVFPVR